MKSDTRDRILVAARTEFSHHGLAGARVDRIALASKASKERLYAYFGDKDRLFNAVLEDGFARFVNAVPFTPRNLTAYALASFSHLSSTDGDLRMLLWAQLQRDGRIHPAEDVMTERIRAVEKAQADGYVDSAWRADDLLTLIFGVVFSWATAPLSDLVVVSEVEIERRKSVISDAVDRLVRPHPGVIPAV